MKAKALIQDHLRNNSLCEENPALAYERGMTDGHRHYRGDRLTYGEIARRAKWDSWKEGFDKAIDIERSKDDNAQSTQDARQQSQGVA